MGESGQAFRWENGVMSSLGALPNRPGYFGSSALGVSADGSVVVGFSYSDNSILGEAFRWENGVMTELGDRPGGYFWSAGLDVSADGSVIVGFNQATWDVGDRAFVWTAASGMLYLDDVVAALGVDVSEWRLFSANAISDDGMTIVGRGTRPAGGSEGWIATLPEDWVDRISYELTVTIAKSDWAGWGTVTVEPNLPTYILGKSVTLTAHPNPGIAFKKWKLYEPNHAGDANYMTSDPNNPITIVMTGHREVKAVFRCANGVEPVLAITLGVLGLYALARRRA